MSTLTATSRKLRAIVDQAAADNFAVPDMQRDFRWGRERIRALLASVIAGHPIGAVTVVKHLHRGVQRKFAPSTSLMSRTELDPSSKAPHILDGQQRLVALLAGFRGPRAAVDLPGKDTDWFETRVNAFGWRLDIARWCELMRQQEGEHDAQDVSLIERSIKASIRTRKTKAGVRKSLLAESEGHIKAAKKGKKFELPLWYLLRQDGSSPKLAREYGAFMKAAEAALGQRDGQVFDAVKCRLEALMSYSVPIVIVGSCATVRAAQMFRRMNQQGMSLSTSDLVCSQLANHDSSLRREMRQYQARADKTEILLPLSGIFEEDILFASLLAGCPDPSVLDLHPETLLTYVDSPEGVGAIRAGFNRLDCSAELCAGLLASCGVSSRRKWPIDAISIALVAAVARHRDRFATRETEGVLRQQVRRWWWAEHLSQVPLGRRPGLVEVFRRFSDFLGTSSVERPKPASFVDAGLADSLRAPQRAGLQSPSLALRNLAECALRGGKPRLEDLFSGMEMGSFSEGIDLHHLFPRAWARRSGIVNVDSIVNLTLMAKGSNRNIIRDKGPKEQFQLLLEEGRKADQDLTEHDVRARLQSHGLDVELFLSAQYSAFCESRLVWLDERVRVMLA